jgi:hypothetical protein
MKHGISKPALAPLTLPTLKLQKKKKKAHSYPHVQAFLEHQSAGQKTGVGLRLILPPALPFSLLAFQAHDRAQLRDRRA